MGWRNKIPRPCDSDLHALTSGATPPSAFAFDFSKAAANILLNPSGQNISFMKAKNLLNPTVHRLSTHDKRFKSLRLNHDLNGFLTLSYNEQKKHLSLQHIITNQLLWPSLKFNWNISSVHPTAYCTIACRLLAAWRNGLPQRF